jgi:DeoR/GlpR family transcriptional regulator of sugar metabolism
MVLSTHDRRAQIAQAVNFEGWASVNELAKHFGVSEVSIRRDLEQLDAQGFVKRVRGGALPVSTHVQGDIYGQRAVARTEQKLRIGRAAAALIQPNDRIILDSGSTVAEVARSIPTQVTLGQHLRVITGSIPVVEALTPYPQIQVLLLGGIYLPQYRTVVGPQTLATLEGLHAEKMFMGSDGLSLESGSTTANVLEAEVTCRMAAAADQVIVVADSSKIGQTGFTTVMPLSGISILVTDAAAPVEFVAALRELGVQVILVPVAVQALQPQVTYGRPEPACAVRPVIDKG